MYINSPGGSVTAGLGIYDTMQYVLPPVATWQVIKKLSKIYLAHTLKIDLYNSIKNNWF